MIRNNSIVIPGSLFQRKGFRKKEAETEFQIQKMTNVIIAMNIMMITVIKKMIINP